MASKLQHAVQAMERRDRYYQEELQSVQYASSKATAPLNYSYTPGELSRSQNRGAPDNSMLLSNNYNSSSQQIITPQVLVGTAPQFNHS